MSDEPRKATDVLLDLERKVDNLVGLIQSQELIIKVLNNKFNDVIANLKQVNAPKPTASIASAPISPKFVPQQMPILDPERHIPISAEANIPVSNDPVSLRRTSRSEKLAGDDAYVPKEKPTQTSTHAHTPKYPVQMPPQMPKTSKSPEPEVIFPEDNLTALTNDKPAKSLNTVPVMQRIVDRTGKSIFLADVIILDKNSRKEVFKCRTNGTGKWMASLGVGDYHVLITKRESLSKEKIEVEQNISIDGKTSPLELNALICR
jgi:hypothetical protein